MAIPDAAPFPQVIATADVHSWKSELHAEGSWKFPNLVKWTLSVYEPKRTEAEADHLIARGAAIGPAP